MVYMVEVFNSYKKKIEILTKIHAKITIIEVQNREPYYFIIICKCKEGPLSLFSYQMLASILTMDEWSSYYKVYDWNSYVNVHSIYGENNVMSYFNVKHCVQMPKEGRSLVEDEPYTGHLATVVNEKTVSTLHLLLQEDERYMPTDIHHETAAWYPYVTES